jgi:simple sugar transport system ATP-binding protein
MAISMSEPLLQVRNISKAFAGVHALNEVNLTINVGEIHCLMGGNGCGKSTLIKIISGVEVPDGGEIVIGGTSYKQLRPMEAIREGIQVIYQDFSLFPNLTVAENIALGSEVAEERKLVNWRHVTRVAKAALKQIGAQVDPHSLVESLSVSDKQLVAISRAIVQKARLIIMDEPTTALTENEVDSLFRVIKNLQAEGISILFVSHKLQEVFEISEKITVVRNGKNVVAGDVGNFDQASLVKAMTGREIMGEPFVYAKPSGVNHPLLKVEKFSKARVFKDISFEVYPGEIIGITGLLGSGRTELALSLFGYQKADSGNLFLDGEPVRIRSVNDAIKNGIAYVPEDRLSEGLFLTHTIGKNIMAGSVRKYLGKTGLLDLAQIGKQSMDWIRELKIATPSSELPVSSLSGGNQQRVVIAKWLARNPRLLILNGPTVGVDVGSKADIHSILRKLAKEGMGVIIISDDLPELIENCSRILLMRKGMISEEFAADSITENGLAEKLKANVKAGAI